MNRYSEFVKYSRLGKSAAFMVYKLVINTIYTGGDYIQTRQAGQGLRNGCLYNVKLNSALATSCCVFYVANLAFRTYCTLNVYPTRAKEKDKFAFKSLPYRS